MAAIPEKERQQADDWKTRYQQLLSEQKEQAKSWQNEENNLYKSILRLILSYSGQDSRLDKEFDSMRATLRKGADNKTRKQVISRIIDQTLGFAQTREENSHQNENPAKLLLELIRRLQLPEQQDTQLGQLLRKYAKSGSEWQQPKALSELAELINNSCRAATAPAKAPPVETDVFLEFLNKFSLPGELGAEIGGLRRRAGEITDLQGRLQLVDDLTQLLKSTYKPSSDNDENGKAITHEHMKEALLQLIEWLPLPEQSKARFEAIKNKLDRLKDGNDLKKSLRDLAALINDLQANLQNELNGIESYLKKVTLRLTDLEANINKVFSSESEAQKHSSKLSDIFKTNFRTIRNNISEATSLEGLKIAIDTHLMSIEQGMTTFMEEESKRRASSERRVQELNETILTMRSDAAGMQKRIEEERSRAKIDALTRVPNRLAYDERLHHEYSRWHRYASPLSLCVIDIDRFKHINDSYGHKAGDKVLITLAELCNTRTRETDFFARYGGEEFILLLPETRLEQAMILAEKLRKEVEECNFHYAKDPVDVTISLGVAEFHPGDTMETTFTRADKALYFAKNNGRNRCVSEKEI